jgi:hypothetical protein
MRLNFGFGLSMVCKFDSGSSTISLPLLLYRLEERRKVKGAAYYARKKAARRQLADAQKSVKVHPKTKTQLAEYGY